MKKILLTVAMIASALSMAKGTFTIGGGAGTYVNVGKKVELKQRFTPTINLNGSYLVPVYDINDKLSVIVGGGLDVKAQIPKITKEKDKKRVQLGFDVLPYGTAQLGYEVAPETKLRFGAKVGVGPRISYDSNEAAKKVKITPVVPMGLVFGVNWKHLSVDLEAGGMITGFKPVNGAVTTGLSVGYSF
ncbi:hypothetical protein [Oceanivirga salmonicida]|uniref:hypothetical protein n=1 Tax=Oceanivirga salmonicida TaxID=1769291 RepID=UPI0008377ECA|nr:hypothetical protein [Oceanivirga salmonicida]